MDGTPAQRAAQRLDIAIQAADMAMALHARYVRERGHHPRHGPYVAVLVHDLHRLLPLLRACVDVLGTRPRPPVDPRADKRSVERLLSGFEWCPGSVADIIISWARTVVAAVDVLSSPWPPGPRWGRL
jgi:hypothetical protein